MSQEKKTIFNVPLIALTSLFFMWGFLRSMTDIIIPYFRKIFTLNYTESMLVQFAFLGAYFIGSLIYYIISFKVGDPIQKLGYKKALLIGISLSIVGCLTFYPASTMASYGMFLLGLWILGLGFTTLEITANAFVSLLGSESSASARLNLTQAFNSLGTTLAPLIGGYMVFTLFKSNNPAPNAEAVKMPYVIFAAVFAALGILIFLIKFPTLNEKTTSGSIPMKSGALKFPQLRMGIFGIFCSTGAEASIGSFIIVLLENKFHYDSTIAKEYLSLYWGGAMLGRFLAPMAFSKTMTNGKRFGFMMLIAAAVCTFLFSIIHLTLAQMSFFFLFTGLHILAFLLGRRSASLTLFVFASICALLVIVGVSINNFWMVYCLLAIGLFHSIMFSNIYTLAVARLGEYTSQGSSLLIMAILGGGIMSLLQGLVADHFGLEKSFLVQLLPYFYMAFFGFYCYKKLKIK